MKLRYVIVFLIGGLCVTSIFPPTIHAIEDERWQELENWAAALREELGEPGREEPADSGLTERLPKVAHPSETSPVSREESLPEPAAPVPDRPASEQRIETAPLPDPPAARRSAAPPPPVSPQENLFAEHFFMTPEQKLLYRTSEMGGFVFVETPGPGGVPEYGIVTEFGGNIVRTQKLAGISNLQEMRNLIRNEMETTTFEGVEVRKLSVPAGNGDRKEYYWVGHKAFKSPDRAFAEIAMLKAAVEAAGDDFDRMVREAPTYVVLPEDKPAVEIKPPANFEREEELMLKMLDALDVGNKMFGPFTGVGSGEPIIWQSFSETTWRRTNLESLDSDVTSFWTNRLLFKGIRAPLSTIDPFLESTVALETDGEAFKDTLRLWAGLEWRPLSTNPWFYNFRPWGLPLLEWVRNYRLYVMYGQRFNIKDEIGGSANNDLLAGIQIFYEFGIDLPPPTEPPPSSLPDYLRKYIWGEYFGNYYYQKTGFGPAESSSAMILNSNVLLGFRLPGIPLPPNPINDELVLMPYMRLEHVNNLRYKFPFQNRYFIAAGLRWMPFRTYQFAENEWLSKVKIFGEYVGVGKVQMHKGQEEEPVPRHDLRFGINISSRRF